MKIKPKQILCVIIVVATNWQKKSWTLKNSKEMKKTILGLMATFMIGATAMAQSQATDNTERIQKRTEYVAKKYGLDDSQAKKLLELNTKYADVMVPRMAPKGGRRGGRAMGQRPRGGNGIPQMRRDSTARRPQMTEEQRAKFEERLKQMEEQRNAYDKELQAIMTEAQYKNYKADIEKRQNARQRR